MKKFLRNTAGFRKLLIDLQILLIPLQFRSLAVSLLAIPSDSIGMDVSHNITGINTLKIMVEDATMTKWNWCPLKPSIRAPPPGYTRISWKCVSHSQPAPDLYHPHKQWMELRLVSTLSQILSAFRTDAHNTYIHFFV